MYLSFRHSTNKRAMKNDTLNILIADDDQISSMVLEIMLNHLGHNAVTIVESPKAAIKAASNSSFDLILMDIHFGNGIDGIQAYEKISKTQDIPVIYMTSVSDNEIYNRAKKTDFLEFIIKPVLVTSLSSALEKVERIKKAS